MADEKNLIDAGKLVDDIDSIVNIFTTSHPAKKILTQVVENYKEMVLRCIEMQPTVDAVEVVRCKDCKCRMYSDFDGCYVCHHGGFNAINPDHFCSYGERRTEC